MNSTNYKTSKKKSFQLLISVDEAKLCSQREEDDSFSIEEAIEREFDWLRESGIYLEKIKHVSARSKNS